MGIHIAAEAPKGSKLFRAGGLVKERSLLETRDQDFCRRSEVQYQDVRFCYDYDNLRLFSLKLSILLGL